MPVHVQSNIFVDQVFMHYCSSQKGVLVTWFLYWDYLFVAFSHIWDKYWHWKYFQLEGMGAYGPLLPAPPEPLNTVQYNIIQWSTVEYSTVTGEEMVSGGGSLHILLCVTANLVAKCAINILFKKTLKITFLKPLFGTSKNQLLVPKVCANLSDGFIVLKFGLK